MYCSKCGEEIFDEAVVCPHCGVATKAQKQEQEEEGNGIAIAGFVCSFFMPILGWVFGGIGLSRAKKRNGKGKGFATASIWVATGMFVLGLLSI